MSLEATIKISPEARDALKALGRKGESYDAVIRRLIDERLADQLLNEETAAAVELFHKKYGGTQ